jgi:DNA-binding response OmpR family regulator
VLVVDNDRDTADTLAMLLKFAKCEVRIAYDGAACLAEAATFLPDLLLADLAMPGMDGNDLAREIRQCQNLDRTVLAAMTGYSDASNRGLAAAAGFTEYLVKPAAVQAIHELLARVAQTIAASRELVDECRRQAEAGRQAANQSRDWPEPGAAQG